MGSQCYLPPGRADIPALTPAEAGTRPEGCKVDLVDLVDHKIAVCTVQYQPASDQRELLEKLSVDWNKSQDFFQSTESSWLSYCLRQLSHPGQEGGNCSFHCFGKKHPKFKIPKLSTCKKVATNPETVLPQWWRHLISLLTTHCSTVFARWHHYVPNRIHWYIDPCRSYFWSFNRIRQLSPICIPI